MTIAESINSILRERMANGLWIEITSVQNLRKLIEWHLSHQDRNFTYDNMWKSLLTNDKECNKTLAVSINGDRGLGVRTFRKDIFKERYRYYEISNSNLKDYEIPGMIPIKRKPKRKLEL